jgi:hypothetical protein
VQRLLFWRKENSQLVRQERYLGIKRFVAL